MGMLRRSPKSPSSPLLPKIKYWVRHHKKLSIVLGIVLLLLLAGGTVAAIYLTNSPLTGSEVASEAITKQATTGIMMENSPDARPQSGLKDSGVVFEAIAEGGITRFLALYQEQKPQLVGPVRSVRQYYVDWVAGFNASVAHVGGSAAALKEVRNGNYRDIDQFFNASTYWRASDRYAPHNVYTSFEKIDALNAKKGFTTSEFTGFTRKDSTATTPTASNVDVKISGPLFNSHHTYNAASNSYDRSQAGKPHLDREAGQISPRVVIVMKVNQTKVFEDGYREQIDAIGTGAATIFKTEHFKKLPGKKPIRPLKLRSLMPLVLMFH
jgi:hypothetical protein